MDYLKELEEQITALKKMQKHTANACEYCEIAKTIDFLLASHYRYSVDLKHGTNKE